jgi:hypothetical protein
MGSSLKGWQDLKRKETKKKFQKFFKKFLLIKKEVVVLHPL